MWQDIVLIKMLKICLFCPICVFHSFEMLGTHFAQMMGFSYFEFKIRLIRLDF